jgi:hypothetical protein
LFQQKKIIARLPAEIKSWSAYFLAIILGVWIHETGHCVPAWLHGYPAFPSPANEYILHPVTSGTNQVISLGGYIGTVLFVLLATLVFLSTNFKYRSELYAGATAIIGMYCALVMINGRGHGGHEFQEAQAAMGFSYAGHSMDVFVITLFLVMSAFWFARNRPDGRTWLKILAGSVITFFFCIALEKLNNFIFDPVFAGRAIIRN